MSKILKLKNGKEIDLDFLYPKEKRFPKNFYPKYDENDDYYGKATKEQVKKYGLQ